jgi:hypothetical protein
MQCSAVLQLLDEPADVHNQAGKRGKVVTQQKSLVLVLLFLLIPARPTAPSLPGPVLTPRSPKTVQSAVSSGLTDVFLAASSQPLSVDIDGPPPEARPYDVPAKGTLHVSDQGAACPVISDLLYNHEQQAIASDGAAGDHFGNSVALWGDTALVGAPSDDVGPNDDQGSVYVFVWIGTTWSEQAHLTAPDGAAGDHFGCSVALWENTALVGAWGNVIGSNDNQGSAYVFARNGTTWNEQQKLTASDGIAHDGFGDSVALWDDTALVGAANDTVGANDNQGSAYVFLRNGTTWREQAHMLASDGAAGDHFGHSVALSSDTALIGTDSIAPDASMKQGSAYVFSRTGASWTERQRLVASGGQVGDRFGYSVALWGDTALVGTPGEYLGADSGGGTAYVFTRSAGTWSQQQKLTTLFSEVYDRFGRSVALWGDVALVGSVRHPVSVSGGQGEAHLFTRSGTTWGMQGWFAASDGEPWDGFGDSVALWGDTVLVGVPGDDIEVNVDQGSVYFYDTLPVITAIRRIDRNPTQASSVRFAVAFSEDVTGVDTADFGLSTTGSLSGVEVASVSGCGAAYTVTVSTGTGNGTLHLDVPASALITDLVGHPLSGLPYVDGETYTVDRAAPTVLAINRTEPSPTHAPTVGFAVTFSEDVTGVDVSDFLPSTTGSVSGAAVTGVSGSGTTYTVTVSTAMGGGTLRLDAPASAAISDLAGNPLTGLPYTNGEVYTILYTVHLPLVLRTVP